MADLAERVAAKIAEIAPNLERTGAHIELLSVEDGIARIICTLTQPRSSRLVASLQVKSGLERILRQAIPELRGVIAVNLPPHTLIGWDQEQPDSVDSTIKGSAVS